MENNQIKLFKSFCNNLYEFIKEIKWCGACHATTAMMFAFAKKIGVNSIPCIGECRHKICESFVFAFDHSWLLIEGKITDIAISMTLVSGFERGPVYESLDINTGMEVDIDYGIKNIGLGPEAEFVYKNNLYDYLKNCPNKDLINLTIKLAKKSGVFLTPEWLKDNLSNEYFSLITNR